ncbi:deoxyribodipyrimidine photo-lyase [Photobacterium nomapromontoriensis]|uniref:deoxyribodipyrimidine photo-lyase n=1 Tax=Photobacterium nomapromontoriensis TaxID=2910237 RepID=UPI003D142120
MSLHERRGLIWFRTDLRIVDNTALTQARANSDSLLAIYISTPMQWYEHHVAPIQIDLIRRRLTVLRDQLRAKEIPLIVVEVADYSLVPQALLKISDQCRIHHVYCNKQYEWNESQRDEQAGQLLMNNKIRFSAYDDQCVIAPGSVLTQKEAPFKIFTPFRRQWLKLYRANRPSPLPEVDGYQHNDTSVHHTAYRMGRNIDLTYALPDTRSGSMNWPVDEEAIRQRLLMFCQEKAMEYHQCRDLPAKDGTSCLSPYLALGMLSPRQCLSALLNVYPDGLDEPESGPFIWLNEIVWREFYRHLIVAAPKLSRDQPFHSWTKYVNWQHSEALLTAWQHGITGFPIVDAAMRQLKKTGWMHNRLRMITASFLTKDLLIHWQVGEQWFMRHLIDGDVASNNGGWQWAASTGTDAQPYFRVFNPTTQGERFDPNGVFIRKWVEELKDVPDRYIHQPHAWPNAHGLNYPTPIVDHKTARVRAIAAFKDAKSMQDILNIER